MPQAELEKILEAQKPASAVDKIRLIWADIIELKRNGISYKQIVKLLPEYYGFEMSYAVFMSCCRLIRERKSLDGKKLPPIALVTEPTTQVSLAFAKAKEDEKDVFAAARAKQAAITERNRLIDGRNKEKVSE